MLSGKHRVTKMHTAVLTMNDVKLGVAGEPDTILYQQIVAPRGREVVRQRALDRMKACIAEKNGADGVVILDENNEIVARVTAWDVFDASRSQR